MQGQHVGTSALQDIGELSVRCGIHFLKCIFEPVESLKSAVGESVCASLICLRGFCDSQKLRWEWRAGGELVGREHCYTPTEAATAQSCQ